MDITEKQITTLRYISLAITIVFGVNLLALLHNLYRYIYKQKIHAPLILLFYLFVTLSFIFRMIELTLVMIKTQFFPLYKFADVTAAVATPFVIYVGLTLILSMH